jgi:hypothetical protein
MTCLSCVAGYTFKNKVCISNFNFQFSVTFTISSNPVFVNNYYSFLLQLANSINTTISSVSISSIKYRALITASQNPDPEFNKIPFISSVQNQVVISGIVSTSATSDSVEVAN